MFEEPRGSLLPFGAHKGYGLAVLAELLAGGCRGAAPSSRATRVAAAW